MNALPSLLLVEDSDTQALQFRLTIGPMGFSVERCVTAEAALERLNDGLPDLLVVDYRLPGMNGDELVRILRQANHSRTLPILMLTGEGTGSVERQGLDSGASAYVPKGSPPALIVERIRALLRQRRPAAAAPGASRGLAPAQMMLIGGSAARRSDVEALLEQEGHALSSVTDPDAARAAMERGAIDCALVLVEGSDFAMLSAIERWRAERSANFEIVALIDQDGGDTVLAGLAAGADDVFAQSSDREMLSVRIRATVRRKLVRDEEARTMVQERERELALERAAAEAAAKEALASANRDLAQANTRLQETQAQLVQSAKMASLGELVAGIAHEINNPLAYILAHQATVERSVREAAKTAGPDAAPRLAKAIDRLGSINEGLLRIQDLVVKLRRFSRIDHIRITNIDVVEAIESVLTLLGPRVPPGVEIVRDFTGPSRMKASTAIVNQVVMNLIANAIDAVSPVTGIVRIATARDADSYRIDVADNGPGIAIDQRDRVFEPFFTTKDVGSGTGLGLSIAYGIVQAHGGMIEIKDSPEGGALFRVILPITDESV